MMRRVFYCILLLLAFVDLTGQSPSFRHLTNVDGLSENWVRQVIKDSRGYIWIATSLGLDRYDGYNIVNYRANIEDSTALRSNDIYHLYLNSSGDLMVGTGEGGVAQFDYSKQHFKNYHIQSDLGENLQTQSVMRMSETNNGWYLFGTYGAGLFLFHPASGVVKQFRHDNGVTNSVLNDQVSVIEKLDGTTFLIGTIEGGLSKLTVNEAGICSFEHYEATLGKSIYNVKVSSARQLWIGTGGSGVVHYSSLDPNSKSAVYVHSDRDPYSIGADFISDIEEDSQGNIWIGNSASGIDRFEPISSHFIHYGTGSDMPDLFLSIFDMGDIHLDKQGNLWFASGGEGLFLYDPLSDQFQSFAYGGIMEDGIISSNKLRTIYEEGNGTIWIGSFSGGVNIYSKYNSFFSTYKHLPGQSNTLTNSSVISFEEVAEDKVWVGTDGGGINVFNTSTRTVEESFEMDLNDPKSISSDNVLRILKDDQGIKWVGTWGGGLNRYNDETGTFDHFDTKYVGNSLISNNIWQLEQDEKGRLWVGSMLGGLHLKEESIDEFIRFYSKDHKNRLNEENIWSIHEDRNGTLWVGGKYLNKIIEKENEILFETFFTNDDDSCLAVNNKSVTAIHEDYKGKLWVAISGTGLCMFDRIEKCFTCLDENSGLSNTNISGLVENDGFLWIGTNDGLFRMNLDDLSFVHFDRTDGLQGNIFAHGACMKDSKGLLYFGGANGMNVFDPSKIKIDSSHSRIAITDFKVYNNSMAIGEGDNELMHFVDELSQLSLNSNQRVFTIAFGALNFIAPEKIEYAYQLEGFDDSWNYVGANRSATYTNLDPGTYTFKVKSKNHSRVWNDNPREIEITIIPPVYQTLWFRIMVILIIALLIYGYNDNRLRTIKRNQQVLEQRVKERTEKLSDEIEQRILTEVELSNALKELRQTQSQLVQSEKLASVGRFVSGIAHELNNPLNFIQGGLEILKNEENTSDGIRLVSDGFKRSSKIVKSLTSISFNNSSVLKQVEVDQIIRNAMQNLSVLFQEDILLETNLAIANKYWVIPDMLHTALEKVFENAVYEMKSSTDKSLIRVASLVDEEDDVIKIMIFNKGNPIPEEIREKIFDPFFTTKEPGEGIGLGLAIAYYFIKQHDGEIDAVNQKDGVTFVITLPIITKDT
ncbi:sensor histidine kinase [Marinoscillum pacificum]|uniref:sensor histidine kinase n=1 Tax=Marinoscillum pacificum TaxID=392723 RepID=UPI0021577100|nr:sensor histidine kinase [Marinoscillum pacificum]